MGDLPRMALNFTSWENATDDVTNETFVLDWSEPSYASAPQWVFIEAIRQATMERLAECATIGSSPDSATLSVPLVRYAKNDLTVISNVNAAIDGLLGGQRWLNVTTPYTGRVRNVLSRTTIAGLIGTPWPSTPVRYQAVDVAYLRYLQKVLNTMLWLSPWNPVFTVKTHIQSSSGQATAAIAASVAQASAGTVTTTTEDHPHVAQYRQDWREQDGYAVFYERNCYKYSRNRATLWPAASFNLFIYCAPLYCWDDMGTGLVGGVFTSIHDAVTVARNNRSFQSSNWWPNDIPNMGYAPAYVSDGVGVGYGFSEGNHFLPIVICKYDITDGFTFRP